MFELLWELFLKRPLRVENIKNIKYKQKLRK